MIHNHFGELFRPLFSLFLRFCNIFYLFFYLFFIGSHLMYPHDSFLHFPFDTLGLSWPENPNTSLLMSYWSLMMEIRLVEEKSAQIYTQGDIGGFCHLCIGQESLGASMKYLMAPEDTLVTAYRCHGHAMARGMTSYAVFCELMGKKDGCSKGKGGSMHFFLKEGNFYGGHGIVGAQVPLGTGLAFSHKYKKEGGICFVFMGDGATNQGQFFEAMNMAALWKLPVVYIIENNGYSMGTSVERGCAGEHLYHRGQPFGIPSFYLPGEDPLVVFKGLSLLSQSVRQQGTPILVEVDTYRFKGHSMSDPGKYRTRQELDAARANRDPLEKLKLFLTEERKVEASLLEAEENRLQEKTQQAYERAKACEEPSWDDLWTDILLPSSPCLSPCGL